MIAVVDDEDFELVSKHKWRLDKGVNTDYAVMCGSNPIRMHRYILKAEKGVIIDHVNHNGLDNRRCNIRFCNASENRKNCIPYGSSKFLGVNKHITKTKSIKKDRPNVVYIREYWRAAIKINGVQTHLGLFKNEEDAARRYDEAARKHHGEFANLNFKD